MSCPDQPGWSNCSNSLVILVSHLHHYLVIRIIVACKVSRNWFRANSKRHYEEFPKGWTLKLILSPGKFKGQTQRKVESGRFDNGCPNLGNSCLFLESYSYVPNKARSPKQIILKKENTTKIYLAERKYQILSSENSGDVISVITDIEWLTSQNACWVQICVK